MRVHHRNIQHKSNLYKNIPRIIALLSIALLAFLQMSLLTSIYDTGPKPNNNVSLAQSALSKRSMQTIQNTQSIPSPQADKIIKNTQSIPSQNGIKVSKIMQLSHATGMNRYPDQYTAVQTYLRQTSSKPIKLLSFGSSYGHEAISLATMYFNESMGFPNVTIYGFDVQDEALDTAKEEILKFQRGYYNMYTEDSADPDYNATSDDDENERDDGQYIPLPITFFDGRNTSLNINGKYDAIFANSVLCDATSQPYTEKVVQDHFPFEYFESTLSNLDAVLKVGGVLAIIQSTYLFEDSSLSLSGRYKVVASCVGNRIPYIEMENRTFVFPGEDEKEDGARRDCVWKKLNGLVK